MPLIGVSRPRVALYSNNNGVVSYSQGRLMGKAVEMNADINYASNNDFYADNAIDETDHEFSDGTITARTNNLLQEVSAMLLGLENKELSGDDAIDGITDTGIQENIYNNKQSTVYTGVSWIEMWKIAGVIRYKSIFFPKVAWAIPANAAQTKGSQIEWQVPEISGTIMRDDTTEQEWKRDAGMFTTEEQADTYCKAKLNITASTVQVGS